MIHLLPLAIAIAAFVALAVSMKRHQRDFVGRLLPEPQARLARVTGWLLLGVVWAIDAALLGPAMGTLVWIGEASMGAWLTVAAITWKAAR
ncbi:DUF3325 domain-containing protein [Novosphingobium resinovorum]|uniref:DUF3325 domain-containing protein n=1 Tax=Novosphingobium resinovorum TaxID=158500 RepID=UPI002ED40176|nr:DUF3325 domain-containing protein [Novosphingobium resinovorum]